MGTYIYRVTAQKVDTPLGKANVAKFAYKPYGFDPDKHNSRMHFSSGCLASERMFDNGNQTGLMAFLDDDGEIFNIYHNVDRPWFYDFALDKMEIAGGPTRDRACREITSWGWSHFRDNVVSGDYRPSVDRREFPANMIEAFAKAFKDQFGRDIYIYG